MITKPDWSLSLLRPRNAMDVETNHSMARASRAVPIGTQITANVIRAAAGVRLEATDRPIASALRQPFAFRRLAASVAGGRSSRLALRRLAIRCPGNRLRWGRRVDCRERRHVRASSQQSVGNACGLQTGSGFSRMPRAGWPSSAVSRNALLPAFRRTALGDAINQHESDDARLGTSV